MGVKRSAIRGDASSGEQPTAQTTSKMTQVIVASYLLRPHRSMSKDSGPIETSSGQRLYFTIVMVSNTGCLAS